VIVVGLLAVVTAGLLVLSVRASMAHTCEVCIAFRGQTACRTASGATPQEATRTATDNACAMIGARGMSLAIDCQNTRPTRVTCDGGD